MLFSSRLATGVAAIGYLSFAACATTGCNLQDQAGKQGVTRVPASTGQVIGQSCASSDPDSVCLAVRYVVYTDGSGKPILSQEEAIQNIEIVNGIWKKCGIGFQIDDFTADDPGVRSLRFGTSSFPELDQIRDTYGDETMLLVTTTGTWEGSLGTNPANAWTSMPGGGPYGSILEKPVARYPYILAHELGHYLNLLHVDDPNDVMNPTIYTYSTDLTPAQCTAARSAVDTYWARMKR